MAEKGKPTKSGAKKETYGYPSYCGSHKSMVDTSVKINDSNFVVCKDYEGLYVTEVCKLDNGMADPYRNANSEWRQENLKKYLAE